jgi:hypothetical protein
MEKLYAHVEPGGNKEITYQGSLPKSWRNVSGLNRLSDEELKEKGWVPLTVVDEPCLEDEAPDGYETHVTDDEVVITARKRKLSLKEFKDHQLAKWNYQIEQSDKEIPRAVEDIYDALPDKTKVAKETADKIAAKKALRASKPDAK